MNWLFRILGIVLMIAAFALVLFFGMAEPNDNKRDVPKASSPKSTSSGNDDAYRNLKIN